MAEAKLKKRVKAQWVAALRSGEYQQGTGALRHGDDTYCCLGVLCELAVKAKVISAPERSSLTASYEYGEEGNPSTLPEEVVEWAFRKGTPDTPKPSNPLAGKHSLAEWNDGYVTAEGDAPPLGFDGIADLIEEHL